MSKSLKEEVGRRRTFAIISHPDAGKTTITERILWHGGLIRDMGDVRGKEGTRAATSDWMTMEQERGVSITSSVMQFDYEGLRVNLLDTPGHKDFGEDTYRTLVAVDSAAMLIDAAKGVEAQTRKLFEVCRLRKVPIFTFANKMDREGKEPLELIDDVENALGIHCYPVTWPIGIGGRFKGLYHRLEKKLYLYTKGEEKPEILDVKNWEDPLIRERVGDDLYQSFHAELELLEGALPPLDVEEFLKGEISPMTFGSAKNNWGVDLFLNLFANYAPGPGSRFSEDTEVPPDSNKFSAFVFKIQANMDKKHRDRVTFLRICSGKFDRGMKVKNTRTGREIRLSYANQFFARERETVDEAFAGDIVGVNDTGNFQIGDTVTDGPNWVFGNIPRFSPEHFGRITIKNALKKKQLQKGLQQLVEEGTVQMFVDPHVGFQDPILGVVGKLQFDVLLYRLNDEYGLESKLEMLSYELARWPRRKDTGQPTKEIKGHNLTILQDLYENPVLCLERAWDLKWLEEQNPEVEFGITPR